MKRQSEKCKKERHVIQFEWGTFKKSLLRIVGENKKILVYKV